MKALPLLVRKLWPRLKFFERRSNVKVKIFFCNGNVLSQGMYINLYESPTSSGEEIMAKIKVF